MSLPFLRLGLVLDAVSHVLSSWSSSSGPFEIMSLLSRAYARKILSGQILIRLAPSVLNGDIGLELEHISSAISPSAGSVATEGLDSLENPSLLSSERGTPLPARVRGISGPPFCWTSQGKLTPLSSSSSSLVLLLAALIAPWIPPVYILSPRTIDVGEPARRQTGFGCRDLVGRFRPLTACSPFLGA